MNLHLYTWTSHIPDGLWVSIFKRWEMVASFLNHWKDPSYVFTVIYEEEKLEVEVLDKTVIRYSFIDTEGVVDDLCFTLEDVENGRMVEWFESTGNEISSRMLIMGDHCEEKKKIDG